MLHPLIQLTVKGKPMNTITRYISSSVNTWLSGMALVLFNQAVIAGSLNISDTPLFLTVSMAPNLVLTLDDSLSMPSAAVPDDINNDDTYNRYKASYYNALYYNPNITYTPPPKYNGTTCSLAENIATCYPNISFTSAPLNGFAPSRGTPVNLNTAYIATKSFSPESTTQTNAGTPDGSSTYYKVDVPVTTTIPAVSYSIKCSVTFTNNSSTDQINISSCTATTGYPAATNFSSISGKTGITVTVTGSSRDGAYTNVTYSSTSRIIVGSKWTTTVGPTSNVTLTWTIPATSSTSTTTTYPAYYYQFYTEVTPAIAAPSGCSANPVKTNDACYVKTIVPENQKQNFANWFSYYRTRNLAVVSSTMRALANIDDNTRVAWQSLNMATASASRPRCDSFGINCDGWSATGDMIGLDKDNRIRRLNAVLGNGKTHKQELFEWLSRFPVAGYTLTLKAAQRAGDYFTGDTGIQHPYADDPHYRQYPLNPDGSSKTSYDACRRNVHILVTDGGWCTNNQGSKEVTVGDTNSSSVTVPLGPNNQVNYNWTPPYPYKDKQADNFADVAFKYWATDLQPTLANNLKPVIKDLSRWSDDTNIDLETEQWTNPKNDPATWQHLTTYAVGLGLKTTLASPYTSWGGSTFAAVTSSIPEDGYPRLKLGTGCPGSTTSTSTASSYCWPYTDPLKSCPPVAADQQRKTYDLWHAAISSRGKFFSSESPDDLVNAFNSIFTEVESNNASAAAAAANSTQTGNDTALFLAQFNSKDWSGHLLDFLVANNGSVSNNIADAKWDAAESAQLNAEGNDALRHIVTFNGSTGVQKKTSLPTFSECNTPA